MGYTHYWYTKPELDKKNWDIFSNLASQIKFDCPIAWEHTDPTKPPEFSRELVRFNGVGDDGHETFYFARVGEGRERENGKCFACCKTAQKPYDKYVTACLLLAKIIFSKDIELASDGENSDWEEGVDVLKTIGINVTIGENINDLHTDHKEEIEDAKMTIYP